MPPPQERGTAPRPERVVIAYLAFLGMLMATGIDISLPAFDEIAADLDAGGNESFIVTLYFVGAAIGQLVAGPFSDARGRRPTLLAGLALYVVGAVGCALAPSYSVLLVGRFVWGMGAAAPTGMRTAIARDLYSGDRMARVTTIMMAVFMLGPIFTLLIGEALLQVGTWRIVFWFCVALGLVAIGSAMWFGETLAPERRQRFDVGQVRGALRATASNRITLGHIVANVFWSGAFFIFLASSQPVFDRIFGRADQFAILFAVIGAATIPMLLINNQVIEMVGARRASVGTGAVAVALSVLGVVYLLAFDSTPSFWIFYGWLLVAPTFITLTSPPIYALALEPMGDSAGTVSSVLFFTAFALGSGLAAIVSVMVDDSVVPFVVGFVVYGSMGFAAQLWAGSATPTTVNEARGADYA